MYSHLYSENVHLQTPLPLFKSNGNGVEGIAVLKSNNNGNGIGRPKIEYPINFKEIYAQWKLKTITGVKAMEVLSLKKNTFYSLIKQYEEGK